MKIKALVTLLVLGSSSLALADSYDSSGPIVRSDRGGLGAPRDRIDDTGRQPYTPPVAAPLPAQQAPASQFHGYGFWRKPKMRPVLLANGTRIRGWSVIDASAQNRTFTQLELKASSGKTDI